MEEQRSAREELVVKARKPYTITKQREKWTEEEHNSFLEALKLYGRAWQRIEDHIGTKTAVQIRSHAQKFFTKLEKEALSKGASPGNVHDIDIHIPPPRPKRKPNSPYPRKTTTIGSLSPSGEASASTAAGGIKPPNPIYFKNDANKQVLQDEENSEGANSSEVLNITQHGWLSVSTSNQGGSTSPILMEFFPTITSSKEMAAVDNLVSPVQSNQHVSSSKQAHSVGINRSKEKNGQTLTGSDNPGPAAAVSPPPLLQLQHNLALGLQHQFSPPPPVVPHNNQQGSYDASFLNMSSAFSNLIISTLQQIPPVHAAASLAASGHLCLNPEIPGGEAPTRDMKPSPSMPSLVTATIAAAGAWWATQGIMPWCPPHILPVFPSPTTTKVPPTTTETVQVPPPPEQHPSDILKQPQSSPKPVSSSSSPSDAVLNQAKASKNTVSDEFGIEDNKTKCCIGKTRDQNHTAFGASLERQPYGFALHTGVAQTKGGVPTKVIENNTEASSSNNNFKHGNFKASRSVFKPYKRCSVEAKENKTTREETGNKRICLPEEA